MARIGSFGAAVRDADPDVESDVFEFYGEEFTVADRVGAMPLLRFASVAEAGVDAEEMAGLAAMHELLRDCLASGDWPRFQKVAATHKASAQELMEVCGAVYRAVTGRPTSRPSDSAPGSLEATPSSKVPSSSVVSSTPTWRDTPFGRRELSAVPELYADVKPFAEAAAEVAAQAG